LQSALLAFVAGDRGLVRGQLFGLEADGREQVLVGEVDGGEVRKWREEFPALRYIRFC